MSEPAEADARHLPVPVVEATPVHRPPSAIEAIRQLPAPVLAASAGFLAGVVALTAVRILRALRHPSRLLPSRRKAAKRDVAATRSFLVDVHLLNRK
ncbi:MAG: hypothetical protein H0T15_04050 [Thermoleophilaceae bacterium]|nr:hypothetical protein [Thermoleophilaceae bacterium]